MTHSADHLRTTRQPRRRARRILTWEREEGGPLTMISSPADHFSDEEYVAGLHRMAEEFEADQFCYFVGGEDGPVKIGCTGDVKKRLWGLQNASPVPLRLLAVTHGGQSRETAYHFTFGAHRLHGEWFERCPEIEAEIERLQIRSVNLGG
jgi:hypothetical protein